MHSLWRKAKDKQTIWGIVYGFGFTTKDIRNRQASACCLLHAQLSQRSQFCQENMGI